MAAFAVSNNAITYIRETPKDKPLMLYVAYTAAHWPLHALPEDIAKYQGRYVRGWDVLRERRLARMKQLGVIEPHVSLSPRHPDVPAWKDEPHKKLGCFEDEKDDCRCILVLMFIECVCGRL
ncbi:MAG: hypothetical protein ACODAD_09110 [Planctomycetota bacterium]